MNPQSANGFWLNDSFIEFNGNLNMTLLDFLRYSQNLRGTKIGCREGDCGACVVIQGKFSNGNIKYQQIVSCLTPMGNVIGTHILTIEGINLPNQLTLPQKSLMETGGTQCGFCTVGFIISLTAYCMNANEFNRENAIKAIDGNICRCTGYKSIIRAIDIINSKLQEIDLNHRLEQLVQANVIPISVIKVAKQMERISPPSTNSNASTVVGGGTDLFVMKRLEMLDKDARYILPLSMSEEKIIERDGNIVVHGSTTVTEFVESPLIQQTIPNIKKIAKLISSTPIRNIATIAGNFVNASPIGDLSILFLALDAVLEIKGQEGIRQVPLKDFFLQYRKVDLKKNETIQYVSFKKKNPWHLNFEKISKRTHLDIASVNSAMSLEIEGDTIKEIHLSVGGVKEIPLYLSRTNQFLAGKKIDQNTIIQALEQIQNEIKPISDIRGNELYKRSLASNLFISHLMELSVLDDKNQIVQIIPQSIKISEIHHSRQANGGKANA